MKITTPQITWHGGENGKNDPVLSADIHPCGALVTAGADADVRVWKLHLDENEEAKFQDYLYSLPGHEKGVNVVRFSPDGRTLATAGDGGNIFLYSLPPGRPLRFWLRQSTAHKIISRLVRTTQTDIYDLCWSPDSKEMCSVSVDSKVAFWSLAKDKPVPKEIFSSHSNYVQGVAWDPRNKYIVSESNDRSCRVYLRQEEKPKKKKKKKSVDPAADAAATAAAAAAVVAKALPATIKEHKILKLLNPEKPKEDPAAAAAAASATGAAVATVGGGASSSAPNTPAPAVTSAPQTASSTPTEGGQEQEQQQQDNAAQKAGEEDDDDIEIVEVKAAPTPVVAPTPTPAPKRAPRPNLFADETVPTFFRRPAWSPDGCLLVTPTGLYREDPEKAAEFSTHIYMREKFDRPILVLPHPGKASIAVRFCPQIFELKASKSAEEEGGSGDKKTSPPSLTNLPYRMVFAVLTVNGILIYDTQHHFPLAFVKNSHYAPLTDATWLSDGSALIATSMDGYVTVICFPDKDLGEPVELSKVPPVIRSLHAAHYDKVLKEAEDEEDEKAEAEERERAEAAQKAREKKKAEEQKNIAELIDVASSDSEGEEEKDNDNEAGSSGKSSSQSPAKKVGGATAEESDEEGESMKVDQPRRKALRSSGIESDGQRLKSGEDEESVDEDYDSEDGSEDDDDEEEDDEEEEDGEADKKDGEKEEENGKDEEGKDATKSNGGKKRSSGELEEPSDMKSTHPSENSNMSEGEKKRAKRIAPTPVSSDDVAASASSTAWPQSKNKSGGQSKDGKQKKRVAPILVSSGLNVSN